MVRNSGILCVIMRENGQKVRKFECCNFDGLWCVMCVGVLLEGEGWWNVM